MKSIWVVVVVLNLMLFGFFRAVGTDFADNLNPFSRLGAASLPVSQQVAQGMTVDADRYISKLPAPISKVLRAGMTPVADVVRRDGLHSWRMVER